MPATLRLRVRFLHPIVHPADAQDRASMVGFNQVMIPSYPTPDGDLALQADRQQMARVYRRITAQAPNALDETGAPLLDETGDLILGDF